MPAPPHASLRDAIQRAFAEQAGDATNPTVIAQATLRQGREVTARLAPILGTRGVEALFQRSLHLTRRGFPWLSPSGDPVKRSDPLAGCRAALESSDAASALAASSTLMVNFTDLLTSLIGPSLTVRLLGPVWNLPDPISEPEPPHET